MGHRDFVQWGPLFIGDLGNQAALKDAFKATAPVAVIHFAGLTQVGESVRFPDRYYDNNIVQTLSLLHVMEMFGVKSIVFSSSAAVYGEPSQIPIVEDSPKQPVNPYGKTKWMVEEILKDYDVAYGVKSLCLRYFNAAGADPDGQIGEHHSPETHLIPLILDAVMGPRQEVTVFGSDYPTPDGTCVRDYVHVTDLAAAHVLAVRSLLDGGSSGAFNLGVGRGYSVNEIIRSVESVTHKSVPRTMAPRRAGDTPSLVAEAQLAMDTLGWKPRFSEIATIVDHAWKWHQKRFREGA